jgi:DNA-binding NarL/FixJ family response regulator
MVADTANAALREWACGYLIKTSEGAELLRAIAAVMRGKQDITPQIAQRRAERFIRDPRMLPAGAMTCR